MEVPNDATLQTVRVPEHEDLSLDQTLSDLGVGAEITVDFEVHPGVTMYYRKLVERTDITADDILREFPLDTLEDIDWEKAGHPYVSPMDPPRPNSGRKEFHFSPRNELTHFLFSELVYILSL